MIFGYGSPDRQIAEGEVRAILQEALAFLAPDAERVLVIIPDATRTAPVPLFFRVLTELLLPNTRRLDFLVALGTHPLMSEAARNRLVGISTEERTTRYRKVGLYNHRWDQKDQLITLGTITSEEVQAITDGRMAMAVPVTINRMVQEYDLLLICGPTYPHEVAGFSGGNKYFFPGISGPEMIHVTHWLGALSSSRAIIGRRNTVVRALIDRATQHIPNRKLCASLVVHQGKLRGLFVGAPQVAWANAASLSGQLHVTWVAQPYKRALACIPAMYEDLWTGAKGMYKLEAVIADGGELVLYAPHIESLSYTHGAMLEQVGYHGSAYYVKQWNRFKHYPWAVLAHSVHVRGDATFDGTTERPRIRLSLASRIPRQTCERLGLRYRDPNRIDLNAWRMRQDTLFVSNAGEHLYRLQPASTPPGTTDAQR